MITDETNQILEVIKMTCCHQRKVSKGFMFSSYRLKVVKLFSGLFDKLYIMVELFLYDCLFSL